MNTIEKQKLLYSVGERIRRIRLLKDIPIKKIASYLNITPQAYGNIERGKSDISVSRLYLLSHFLNEPLVKIISEEYYSAIVCFENNEFISDSVDMG